MLAFPHGLLNLLPLPLTPTGFLCVLVLGVLECTKPTRLASTSQSPDCFCLLSIGMKGMYHHHLASACFLIQLRTNHLWVVPATSSHWSRKQTLSMGQSYGRIFSIEHPSSQMCIPLPRCAYDGQRRTYRDWFSPSTLQVLRIQLKLGSEGLHLVSYHHTFPRQGIPET